MKTQTELTERLDVLTAGLHLHHDSLQGYFVGQITALLWAIGQRPTWVDCHIAADELWAASRQLRGAETAKALEDDPCYSVIADLVERHESEGVNS